MPTSLAQAPAKIRCFVRIMSANGSNRCDGRTDRTLGSGCSRSGLCRLQGGVKLRIA
jgi:hypothetical protein